MSSHGQLPRKLHKFVVLCKKSGKEHWETVQSSLFAFLQYSFFLSQMFPFLPFYFGHQNMLFCLHPNLQPADYFSLGEKELPFITEIITLRWREGELCIWRLPAARCMWGITFHFGKVISEPGLCSALKSFELGLLYSRLLCLFSYIKARYRLWEQDNQFLSSAFSQKCCFEKESPYFFWKGFSWIRQLHPPKNKKNNKKKNLICR